MILDTDYHYRVDWQYQTIRLNTEDLSIQRAQNYMINGSIQHSTDIICVGDPSWDNLFKQYGHKAYVEYKEAKAITEA